MNEMENKELRQYFIIKDFEYNPLMKISHCEKCGRGKEPWEKILTNEGLYYDFTKKVT